MSPSQIPHAKTLHRILKFSILTIIAAVHASSTPVGAAIVTSNAELCSGFVPENDMRIPVGFKSFAGTPTGISEAEFNTVLDRLQKLYGPVIAKAGGTLQINRLWSNSTVNASAIQQGQSWIINMYGGMARHPAINLEGFASVACHELGHHLGGAPKGKGFLGIGAPSWASNEGQSDYFTMLKCMREFFLDDDNASIVDQAKADGKLSTYAANVCDQQFASDVDRAICKRSTLGAFALGNVLRDLGKSGPIDFTTPTPSSVTKTDDKHPAAQCRLDTYFAGATCDVDKSVSLSNSDFRQGTCVQNVAKIGFRPRCWFAP